MFYVFFAEGWMVTSCVGMCEEHAALGLLIRC